MENDTTATTPSGQPVRPLHRDVRSPGVWAWFFNYLLLGGAAVVILIEIINSGAWGRLGVPLLLIALAIGNLARLHASERRRAKPSASG
jgi:hypothetical protein